MAAAFAFLGMLLVSLLVGVLVALQLGDFFITGGEFSYVISVLVVLVTISMGVLVAVDAKAKSASTLCLAAWMVAAAEVALIAVPGSVQWIANHSTNPYTINTEQTAYRLEMALPAVLAVLTQWGLLRRLRLRTAREDDLARWPWIATVVAGLAIFNPPGLAVIWTALFQRGEMMWSLFATVAGVLAAVLVVIAVIECYIRGRIRRRRAHP